MSLLYVCDDPHNSDHEDTQSYRSFESANLPNEILENIFSYLSIENFCCVASVNSKWNECAHSKEVWKIWMNDLLKKYQTSSSSEVLRSQFISRIQSLDTQSIIKEIRNTFFSNSWWAKDSKWDSKFIKAVVVGEKSVGKTCLISKLTCNTFLHEYQPTIFGTASVKTKYNGSNFSISLWVCKTRKIGLMNKDTSGDPNYDRVRHACYSETDIFLLAVSVDDPVSWQKVCYKWSSETEYQCPSASSLVVCLQSEKKKENPQLQAEANERLRTLQNIIEYPFIECSSLTGDNLEPLLQTIIKLVVDKKTTKRPVNKIFQLFDKWILKPGKVKKTEFFIDLENSIALECIGKEIDTQHYLHCESIMREAACNENKWSFLHSIGPNLLSSITKVIKALFVHIKALGQSNVDYSQSIFNTQEEYIKSMLELDQFVERFGKNYRLYLNSIDDLHAHTAAILSKNLSDIASHAGLLRQFVFMLDFRLQYQLKMLHDVSLCNIIYLWRRVGHHIKSDAATPRLSLTPFFKLVRGKRDTFNPDLYIFICNTLFLSLKDNKYLNQNTTLLCLRVITACMVILILSYCNIFVAESPLNTLGILKFMKSQNADFLLNYIKLHSYTIGGSKRIIAEIKQLLELNSQFN